MTRHNQPNCDSPRRRSVCLSKLRVLLTFTNMIRVLSVLALVAVISAVSGAFNEPDTDLKLVYVLFRHGDRTPVQYELDFVPENPYANYTFEPFGPGQLLNKGKVKMFKRGAAIRERYNDFLGEIAYPDTVKVYTTSPNRVQATALAFLSGLWPPAPAQQWSDNEVGGALDVGRLWSPLAYSPSDIEKPISQFYKCPTFVTEFAQVQYSPFIRSNIQRYEYLLTTISEKIGKKVVASDVIDLVNLYRGLKGYGLPVPEWVTLLWEPLLELLDLNTRLQVSNDKLRQLAGGVILSRLVNDTIAKVNEDDYIKNTKVIVHAAHDSSVMGFLGALGGAFGLRQNWKDFFVDYPDFGATIVVEVHQIKYSGKYGIKVLYTNSEEPDFIPLSFKDCSTPCPIDDFIRLRYRTLINPEDFQVLCNGKLSVES